MGIRLYWPLWLIRLYHRFGAGRFEWTVTLVAVLAGVMASGALDPLSGVLDGWFFLFGFAIGLVLIWFALWDSILSATREPFTLS